MLQKSEESENDLETKMRTKAIEESGCTKRKTSEHILNERNRSDPPNDLENKSV